MIHSITFKDPATVTLPKGIYCNYAFDLPSLKGKSFEFRPGVNVIVGKNGCGKTSLLNVIRALTFCDKMFCSSLREGRSFWELHTRHQYESGYWHLADLKAQYLRSTMNLRKSSDVNHYDCADSTENFLQSMNRTRSSDGQDSLSAIALMIKYFKYGEGWNKKKGEKVDAEKDEHGLLRHQNFRKMVIEPLEKEMAHCNDAYKSVFSPMLEYYRANDDDTLKGPTFLMDEPDKSMDIDNVKQVYDLLTAGDHSRIQDIVVLHNIGLIHQLKKLGDKVNFIELTEGYVQEVEKFFAHSI